MENDFPCLNCIVKSICRNRLFERFRHLLIINQDLNHPLTIEKQYYYITISIEDLKCEFIDEYCFQYYNSIKMGGIKSYNFKPRSVLAKQVCSIFNIHLKEDIWKYYGIEKRPKVPMC